MKGRLALLFQLSAGQPKQFRNPACGIIQHRRANVRQSQIVIEHFKCIEVAHGAEVGRLLFAQRRYAVHLIDFEHTVLADKLHPLDRVLVGCCQRTVQRLAPIFDNIGAQAVGIWIDRVGGHMRVCQKQRALRLLQILCLLDRRGQGVNDRLCVAVHNRLHVCLGSSADLRFQRTVPGLGRDRKAAAHQSQREYHHQ